MRARLREYLPATVVFVAAIALWEGVVFAFSIQFYLLPAPIAIVTLMTFFPTFISSLRGLLSAKPESLALLRAYAASEWQVFTKLRLPSSLPFMFTAFRACTTLAMIGAVVSEFFGGPVKSLGVYIKSTASLFQTRQAWSAILVACALGLAVFLP